MASQWAGIASLDRSLDRRRPSHLAPPQPRISPRPPSYGKLENFLTYCAVLSRLSVSARIWRRREVVPVRMA